MLIKTVLNKIEKHKGFVYRRVRLEMGGRERLLVDIQPDKRCNPVCSGCDEPCPGYDKMQKPRFFDFVPLWGILVVFVYVMRRVKSSALERVRQAEQRFDARTQGRSPVR